jgi:hypothetical protein
MEYVRDFIFLFSGVVTLLKDYTVCEKGNVLTPEQARILVSELIICVRQKKFNF